MPSEEWLVDGYNLIRDWERRLLRGGAARERVFALLAGFASAGARRMTVVLDGKGPGAELEAHATACFRVVYSGAADADACIERAVCESKDRASIMVVTADRAIAALARGAGARVMTPASLWEAVQEAERERGDVQFRQKVRGHGFHRPFEEKL